MSYNRSVVSSVACAAVGLLRRLVAACLVATVFPPLPGLLVGSLSSARQAVEIKWALA
jgi:hypothetical protein